jgi:signal transduction histidine kinase
MLVIMTFIYLLFSRITRNDFYETLHQRTEVAAQLYLEADEISQSSLDKIKEKFLISLPQEIIRVYDSSDEVSFTKKDDQNWSKAIINEVRSKKYLAYKEGKKQVVGISYDDNQGNFVILASAVDVYGAQRKTNLLKIMAALFGIQILIQFIAGRLFARNALLPIQKVNAQVQKISATDLHLRVATNNERDELGLLAANFNGLLERLEKSFDLQKMFVANASHELKTPVTNIIGEIEVAASKDRTNEELANTLQSVLAEAERLNEIIHNFLLLANAENDIGHQLNDEVRMDELLWELKDTFKKQGNQVDIQLSDLPEEEADLYIKSNKVLLTVAVSNIINNAVKFSNGHPVVCTLYFRENNIIISVKDNGIGMDDETIQNIFEPFYRSPASSYPGNGIGLYIAKKIIALLGGRITVSSYLQAGATFNIIFGQKPQF